MSFGVDTPLGPLLRYTTRMTTERAPIPKFIGARVRRREDPELITGRARFVADIQLDNVLHLTVWRSPVAHGRVLAVRTEEAEALPGVAAVLTAEDLQDAWVKPLPLLSGAMAGSYEFTRLPKRYPLACGLVRFAGEGVAVVLAEDAAVAADALERIEVELEPLPALTSTGQALEEGAPSIHDRAEGNRAFVWTADSGGVDEAFQRAAATVDLDVRIQRLVPTAMEPRAVLAAPDSGSDGVTLWTTTQIPHQVQGDLAKLLDWPAEQIRVIAPEVGGGFGAKAAVYPEEALAVLLARRFGRPVRWVATRSEDSQATTQGRDQHDRIRLAADREGRLLAADLEVHADLGAWVSRVGAAVTPFTGLMMTGVYDIPAARARAVGVLTNKPPVEPYRGAGRPEAAYLIERAMDALARKLGMDPAELRRRNFVPPERFPYRTAIGIEYDSGNYAAALERALELAGYPELRRLQGERRREGGDLLGIGVACYVEICGFGPWETGGVSVDAEANVVVLSGTSPHGQGHQTTWAQLAAEVLQVPMETIEVKHGDTAVVPQGVGTFGSRSAPVGGSAVFQSAQTVRDGARAIAAHLLEASEEDLRLEDGKFFVVGAPQLGVSWKEVAAAAHSEGLPEALRGRLRADTRYEPKGETYPFGTHVCVVEIDRETGQIRILRYLSVDDCGRVINPLIVEGQVHGGAAQGIGQALWEQAPYDEAGNPLAVNLLEYALPRADSLPAFESHRTETPTPLNPLGVKGIGEAATIGSTPAVVNAVADALEVEHVDTPLTAEKIWRLL